MLRAPDVHELALAQGEAGLVVQAHQRQHLGVREAELGQPVQCHPRQREQRVAGVDRLRHAADRPQRGAMAPLDVAVLDVVVDQAEVVAQFDRRGAGQGRSVVAGQRLVGEQAEQRPQPFAARRIRIEPEVVAHHLVQGRGVRVLGVRDDAQDLRLGVGDQQVEVGRGQHGREDNREAVGGGRSSSHTWYGATSFVEAHGAVARRSAYACRCSARLPHDCDGPVALRAGRGGPRPDVADAARRQAQGHRQGRAPAQEPDRRIGRAVRRAAAGHGPRPDVRRDHVGRGRRGVVEPARPARVDRHRLVPGRAGRARGRGARGGLPGLCPAPARLPAARRRHGAGARRALVRVRPGRCAGHAARRSSAASSATAFSSHPRVTAGCRRWAACCATTT